MEESQNDSVPMMKFKNLCMCQYFVGVKGIKEVMKHKEMNVDL
jgi:hypothetical protein